MFEHYLLFPINPIKFGKQGRFEDETADKLALRLTLGGDSTAHGTI